MRDKESELITNRIHGWLKEGDCGALAAVADGIRVWAQEQVPGSFFVSTESVPELPIGQVVAASAWLRKLAEEIKNGG